MMRIDWSTRCCCGKQAEQRKLTLAKPNGVILPDVCDECFASITRAVAVDDAIWAEIERRQEQFEAEYEIVGFTPIIEKVSEV